MSQTTYAIDPPEGIAGQIYDVSRVQDRVSALVEDAAGLNPGLLVARGSEDDQVIAPAAAADITDTPVGITVWDGTLETADPLFPQNKTVAVLRKGRIRVNTVDAAAAGGDVYVRFQNGTADFPIGSFAASNVGGDYALLPGAVFHTSQATAGGLVVVEINLP